MNPLPKFLCAGLSVLCGAAAAAPDAPAQSAALTARNIALVSSALAAHQKGVNAMASTRAAHILSVRRLAANAQQSIDREVAILNQTGGKEIVKLFDALREHGDRAALVSAQMESAEAAAKADIAAAYVPLAISTDKLDSAAQKLAGLARQQSRGDRAKFLLQFLVDVREESKKLQEDSDKKREAADTKLAAEAAVAEPAPKTSRSNSK